MLKLKRVQILGFKSFCDRTDVQLAGAGIAAVVGPNGCGKSNISDAITWVLGEQSAKSLRGIKMEDVIFAGTRDRKPTGMAEVSLTLVDPEVYDHASVDDAEEIGRPPEDIRVSDWDEDVVREERAAETEQAVAEAQPGTTYEAEAKKPRLGEQNEAPAQSDAVVLKVRRRKFGRAPVRAGEITITRRLFRSGDSEYLLNGKICRLRDIQDIFLGTGLGGESYAIIGQERIGQLLSAKPVDRRGIIEEAAGITRFKTKKRLAELRLESAKQNLSRVDDIFEEVGKQMTSLKRQAAKAERYGEIRTELRVRLRATLASRLTEFDGNIRQTNSALAAVTERIDTQAAQVEELDGQHTAGVRLGFELDQAIREQAAAANAAALELERIQARTHANTDRVAELANRLESGTREQESAHAHLAELTAALEEQRAFLATASAASLSAREDAAQRQAEAQEAARAMHAREQAAEANRHTTMQLMQRAAQIRQEQAQAEAALAGLDQESARLLSEAETARAELSTLGLERGEVRSKHESTTERLKRLELEIAELRLETEARRTEEADSKRQGDKLRGEIAGLNGRRASLEGLIRDHSYSTDTVKNLLRATQKKLAQGGASPILGTMADFLEVDDNAGPLIDEFLKEELNILVARDWAATELCLDTLRSEVTGRATFLVKPEGVPSPALRATDLIQVEGVRPLADCVRVQQGMDAAFAELSPKLRLGYLAPDVETARTLAQKHGDAYLLAPSGEIFHGSAVTGGRPSIGGPLALKRDLREVETKFASLSDQLVATESRTAALAHELSAIHAQMESKHHERRDAEREMANSSAVLRQMESEAARLERRLQDWTVATDRNRDARTAKQTLIESRQGQAAGLEAERTAHEAALGELTAAVTELRAEREQLSAAASAAAAALAGLEERRRNAEGNLAQTTRLHGTQQHRIMQLEESLAQAAAERARREEETATLAARHGTAADAKATALAENARLTAEAKSLRETTAALDAQLRSVRAELEALREQRAGLSSRLARLSAELEHLEAACLNDLAITAEELRADEAVERLSGEALLKLEGEARDLKKKLEALGPVNMMALEEYAEARDRHAFLEAQRMDLLDSISNTQASIKEIDDVSRLKFDEAYRIINENFALTFTKLFGGGQATMRLTDEENSAESGIEIEASPPGKKLQNILLLSGGEKALTALSLLVGIFQFQPAPFCILDEVDAPLDETNVGRFARMIAEMSVYTQFIAITHNKRTMSEADVIYGVTMQEPGVSKVVSVNLQAAPQARSSRAA